MIRRAILGASVAAALSGCASWNRIAYTSTEAVTPRLPASCETTVTFLPGWDAALKPGRTGVSAKSAGLAASGQVAVAQDVAANLCGTGAPLKAEVEVYQITFSSNPSIFTFLPLPGLGAIFGLPLTSFRSSATVSVRLRRGSTVIGTWRGESAEHRYRGVYYGGHWEPSDSTGGGIVAAALQHAMEDAKKKVAADRSAIAAATAGGPESGGPAPEGLTVAVADLEANGVPATDAAVVANMLRGELVQTGTFRVVEKANMDKLLAEQAFQRTGCTSQECAVKLGKILNVKRMVVGSFGKLLNRYYLNVRVVSVESGEVVQADEARGDSVDQLEAALKALAGRLSTSVR